MFPALCLAAVIYAEARGEPPVGQLAVAHVVLNRAEHDPERICEVTRRPHQFARLRPSPEFIELAVQILNHPGEDPTEGADHFHSGPIPYWAPSMTRTTTIGGHTFYASN